MVWMNIVSLLIVLAFSPLFAISKWTDVKSARRGRSPNEKGIQESIIYIHIFVSTVLQTITYNTFCVIAMQQFSKGSNCHFCQERATPQGQPSKVLKPAIWKGIWTQNSGWGYFDTECHNMFPARTKGARRPNDDRSWQRRQRGWCLNIWIWS